MNEMKAVMEQYRLAVEDYLNDCFMQNVAQKTVMQAMRYSLLAGGKRIRPILVLEFCRLCGGDWHEALPFAASIEMVHTYSLIHDDLPCMDNDDYRRGKLTNHKVFGQANAVLAGDGLLTAAFETAAHANAKPERAVKVIAALADAAGALGMVGGQVLDLEGEDKHLNEDEIYTVHRLKTGALIRAACQMGVLAAGGTNEQLQSATAYAEALGLAFQLQDDLLDVLGDAEKMGKKTGMDEHKNTFVRLYGADACKELVQKHTQKAIEALSVFEEKSFLQQLAEDLSKRDH